MLAVIDLNARLASAGRAVFVYERLAFAWDASDTQADEPSREAECAKNRPLRDNLRRSWNSECTTRAVGGRYKVSRKFGLCSNDERSNHGSDG